MSDCKVCLIEHDKETHAATLAVHRWFRNQVTRRPRSAEEVAAEAAGKKKTPRN